MNGIKRNVFYRNKKECPGHFGRSIYCTRTGVSSNAVGSPTPPLFEYEQAPLFYFMEIIRNR